MLKDFYLCSPQTRGIRIETTKSRRDEEAKGENFKKG